MKLLSKTSLLIITASIFIFWLGNIVFFSVSKEMISKHINSELLIHMDKIKGQIQNIEPDLWAVNFSEISINTVDRSIIQNPVFSDTVLYSDIQKTFIPHRALRFSHQTEDRNYLIIIYKSLLSSDKLIERITVSSIVMVIAFIIVIYVLNRFIFTNVWSSFSSSLLKVEEYDIKSLDSLTLPGSEIDEFDKLNKVLLKMVERIQSDYRSLKELTANTSHEIQTPLAIIKSKAEILLQSEKLSEEDIKMVDSILNTTGRLSKLNQSLLLIARIENNQFEESEAIELRNAIGKATGNLEMLFEAGEYVVKTELNVCSININPTLLDVLISNLLKNAILHGIHDSEIMIKLKDCRLAVTNRGEPLPFPSDQLFKRFIKGSNEKSSSGIGLEIVRKICNYYQIEVQHSYEKTQHTFSVDFSKIQQIT
jgi:signal transduction histidine kinase